MVTILSQPFPGYRTDLSSLRFYAMAGFIVSLMLFSFRPFGLSRIESDHFVLHILLYGLGTFVFTSLNGLLASQMFPSSFKEQHWTVGKELAMILFHLTVVSFVNWGITHFLYGVPPAAIPSFMVYTVALGIFPLSFLILIRYILLLRANQKSAFEAEQILQEAQDTRDPFPRSAKVTLRSENGKDVVLLMVEQIIYIEAADNYIKVFIIEADKLTSKMLRCSLKKAEQELSVHSRIFRCHRAYLVNLQHVRHVSGNAQGLKLHLEYTNEVIPVSRSSNRLLLVQLEQVRSMQFTPQVL